jgi:hypothetical protein
MLPRLVLAVGAGVGPVEEEGLGVGVVTLPGEDDPEQPAITTASSATAATFPDRMNPHKPE